MDPSTSTIPLLGFYVTVLILTLMVAYAGFEGTMRVFTYLDLQFRYSIVKLQMLFMGWKLKRQLVKDTERYTKFIEGIKDEH